MTTFIFTRRAFLIGGGTIVGVGAAATVGSLVACNLADGRSALVDRLPRLFVAIPGIRDAGLVGREFADRVDALSLVDEIAARPAMRAACATVCDATRIARLRESFREDFGSGRHIVVRRWVLSESEALIAGAWVLGLGGRA